MRKIVLFGDSLTQESFSKGGWGQLLADRYVRRADVLNRGFSGYNSRWVLQILDSLDIGEDLVLATICLGANDASQEKQNVPVKEYESNITKIVQFFQRQPSCQGVILITPPPVDEQQYHEVFVVPRRGAEVKLEDIDRKVEYIEPYAQACARVATACGIPLVNAFTGLLEEAKKQGCKTSEFLSDGLHFNEKGNAFIYERVVDQIRLSYPGLHVTPCEFTGKFSNSGSTCADLQPLGPWWDKIDPVDFQASFSEPEPAAKKAKTNE